MGLSDNKKLQMQIILTLARLGKNYDKVDDEIVVQLRQKKKIPKALP